MKSYNIFFIAALFLISTMQSSCEKNDTESKYDINSLGIPKFINNDFIELFKVIRISKFRSGAGHDYSDDFESCRSMKHYYSLDSSWAPTNTFNSNIYSPLKGKIDKLEKENSGNSYQIWIKSEEYPAFNIILFHVNISNSIKFGMKINAGEMIGTVTGTDIAVIVNTLEGIRYISYFDIMTDNLFTQYQNRGINDRNEIIISKEIRDANPIIINCNNQDPFPNQFETRNEDWVILN